MDSVCPPLIVRHASFDQVVSHDMHACKTTPEPYIATIKFAPPLNQVFQNVSFDKLIFPSYSIGAARKSILESVQLELTEITDVTGMDPESLQKLTEPVLAHYTSLNPTTAAALDNFVPAKTSFLISGGSIVLSLFLFILNFPLFHRQARALCCAPRRLFKIKSGQFIHVTNDIKPDSNSSFSIWTRDVFTALRASAKEALLKTEATAPYTYSAEYEEKLYPDVTAQTRTIRTTPPLVLTTSTPAPVSHVDTTQNSSAEVSSPSNVSQCLNVQSSLRKIGKFQTVNASSERLCGTSMPPSNSFRSPCFSPQQCLICYEDVPCWLFCTAHTLSLTMFAPTVMNTSPV